MISKGGVLNIDPFMKNIADQIMGRLNTLGYRVGQRVLELTTYRAESNSKAPKRETRFLPTLMSIHSNLWKFLFGRQADAIEKSVSNDDEYMVVDNDPPWERFISVPKDMSQLSCSSFTAGIVEAVLDGLGFVRAQYECLSFFANPRI